MVTQNPKKHTYWKENIRYIYVASGSLCLAYDTIIQIDIHFMFINN